MNEETNLNFKKMKEGGYSIFHQEYIIMAEYRMLQTENLPGIYVIPSHDNSFLWYGVIFIRSGLYTGGVFRFTLNLPEKFPDDTVPTVKFTSQIFHPAIDPITGILSLNEVFSHWDRKQNHVWQILKYLHWIFTNLNMKVPVNNEASALFKTNRKLFIDKVKECVASSIEHVYDVPPIEDKHYITFQHYDPNIHDTAKNVMLKPPGANESSHGISWVQSGSYQSFSKEDTT
ncbi:protein crossbronx homolog [Maniola jurtina]|uniref:protein crossbronx homolog n=1 Tax=Maniola jurtina TaxID=191418 RepID=UPI001E68FB0B|nr:protein crossbronx homolog [Maniola jurtina]